ncbi:MAG TPA: hypothetical protein VGL70_09060 [Candidatus Binatia bacterium]
MTKLLSRLRRHGFRAGDWVEVGSAAEILATLDDQGRLDALPFMPEMLQYCGRRVRVYKRADKTCDTIEYSGSRRMFNTVHLDGLRCGGAAHGGCQAGCLLFWKEAWLRRAAAAPANSAAAGKSRALAAKPAAGKSNGARCDRARLLEMTRADDSKEGGEPIYRCQATELRRASYPLAWWDLRQYLRDVRSGNVGISDVIGALIFRGFLLLLRCRGYRLWMFLYETIQKWRSGIPYPFKQGSLVKTPRAALALQPGEMVRVKSQDEIIQTVNARNRNHGLSFDPEMVKYCGGTYRVVGRVERLIDEKTGKMTPLSNDCIILDGVVCGAHFSNKRLFCPRSLYTFWREIWLQRIQS